MASLASECGLNSLLRLTSWRTDEVGDSILVLHLREIVVFPPMKFKNRRQEEFYWRTVRDVKLTLPYAKLIAETLVVSPAASTGLRKSGAQA